MNMITAKFLSSLFLLIIVVSVQSFAQTTITGNVFSDTGEPLPGVNILLKGTNTGTTTDANGVFNIRVPGPESVLVFSSVGFTKEEVVVGNQTNLKVHLLPDLQSLQEVVVIGYGTQRKEDVTTSVVQIAPEKFVPGAVRNAGELLRGKVAGLTLNTTSGDPEAGVEILLRGITSIYGSSTPLVLIDGYPGGLNAISPNDIESITVLKDASASAIYGTRGKNGVILITTKKSTGGTSPVIEYSGYVATDRFQKTADFMSASDVRRLIDKGVISESYDLGGDTDWLDEISRNPLNHFHNISLRGGNERTQYVANASYQVAEGIFMGSGNDEFKLRMDLTHYLVEDKLKVNVNVLKGIQNYEAGFSGWTYRQALIRNPTDKVKNEDGEWMEHTAQFQYENPVALVKEQVYDNQSQWTWLTGSLSYFPIENLEVKLVGSQHQWSRNMGTYQTKNHISTVRDNRNGVAYINNEKTIENFLDLTADYNKTLGKSRISGLVGYSYIDWMNSGSSITNFNFPTDNFSYNSIEQGRALREGLAGASVDSYKSDWKLIGFFGRVGYGFDDRFNILASLRYEGSSRLGADHKWGLFPAVSLGWTISNENFLEDLSVVNNLKLRAGYGRTGSISTGSYESLTRFAYSATQLYFNGTQWVSVLSPVANPNPNLGWETNIEYNVGVDFGLLLNRISGSVDYYDRTLEDLVYSFPVPSPPNLVGTTLANAATMTNKGVEVALNFIPVSKKDFEWNTGINYSRNINKLKALGNDEFKLQNDFIYAGYTGDPIQLSTHKVEVDKAIGSFYGYKSVGLEEDPSKPGWGTWLIESPEGEVKSIKDANADDMQIIGNGMPKWYAAWNNYFRYKNFDLNVTMRGAFDFQILNYQRMFYENPTIVYNRLNTAFDPIDGLLLSSPQSYVSHYIENGDYWKIDNVTLGYNLPTIGKTLKSARLYVSASNLATITGYKGLDPEVRTTGLDPGNDDRDKYPTTRTFTIGVDLKF